MKHIFVYLRNNVLVLSIMYLIEANIKFDSREVLVVLQVIRRDLVKSLRKKRPDMADNLENVVLHQDNAPSHTANRTQLEIDLLDFQRVDHPPYSPDLAPLDFAYFPKLKKHLRGTRFQDREEIRYAIRSFNKTLNIVWLRKCLKSG